MKVEKHRGYWVVVDDDGTILTSSGDENRALKRLLDIERRRENNKGPVDQNVKGKK